MMKTIEDINQLRKTVQTWRDQGLRICFVPTMGNLHQGHLQLMDKARQIADKVVASIFVNPLQFGENEDFGRYPRTFEADCWQLQQHQVDAVFFPSVETMYPNGMKRQTIVEVPNELTHLLCGASRLGHFTGVSTVVTKLLNLVQPDCAVFGEKDYQQLLVVQRLVTDLCLPIDIIPAPICREDDNLAMSSRNQYLTPEQRQLAPQLFVCLQWIAQQLQAGSRDFEKWSTEAYKQLAAIGFKPDYVDIRRAADLQLPNSEDTDFVILVAAFLGQTRLIDNIQLSV
ncbi:MAG: pantoate--beta-alanine ligase [Thiotrichaceae bacterium]|nr:pantoate--beta-alanine ligase [Thiotrichaceae bacterium]